MTAEIGKDFYFILVTTDYNQRLPYYLGRKVISRLRNLMAAPQADPLPSEKRIFFNLKKGGRCIKLCRHRSGLIMRHPQTSF